MLTLECGPGNINDKREQSDKDEQRINPPGILAVCLARAFEYSRQVHFSHKKVF
jgi:hypothetical protein